MLSAPSILMAKKYCECRNETLEHVRGEEEEWLVVQFNNVTVFRNVK